jgi:Na+-transporting NADH:ubiquinone oxidoreductase subunit C
MTNDSPQKALLVVLGVALVCSILVSVAAITLQPIQQLNQLAERSRNIVALTGLVPAGAALTDDDILATVEKLDIRVVNIDTGDFDNSIDPAEFNQRAAANDPALSTAIPASEDLARLGRRSRFAIVYLVWQDTKLERIIVPIHGQGMWSTLFGYIALEANLNTIAAVSFYEQAETAGLGDQITRPDWQTQWQGRELFNNRGELRFRIGPGSIDPGSAAARHQVDALSGATVTGDAVTRLVAYWFGPHGYMNFLDGLVTQPPVQLNKSGAP